MKNTIVVLSTLIMAICSIATAILLAIAPAEPKTKVVLSPPAHPFIADASRAVIINGNVVIYPEDPNDEPEWLQGLPRSEREANKARAAAKRRGANKAAQDRAAGKAWFKAFKEDLDRDFGLEPPTKSRPEKRGAADREVDSALRSMERELRDLDNL